MSCHWWSNKSLIIMVKSTSSSHFIYVYDSSFSWSLLSLFSPTHTYTPTHTSTHTHLHTHIYTHLHTPPHTSTHSVSLCLSVSLSLSLWCIIPQLMVTCFYPGRLFRSATSNLLNTAALTLALSSLSCWAKGVAKPTQVLAKYWKYTRLLLNFLIRRPNVL